MIPESPRSRLRARLAAAIVTLGAAARTEPLRDDVALSITGSERETAAIAGAVREPLEQLGLRVSTAAPAARAHVRIDAKSSSAIEIEVSVSSRKLPAMRRIVARNEPEPVVVEQVAYVVRTTLESMLGLGDDHAGSADEAPNLAPEPGASPDVSIAPDAPDIERRHPRAPGTPRVTGWRFSVAPFATERAMSSAITVPGLGLALGATLSSLPFRPGLWISGSLHSDFDASAGDATVAGVHTHSVRFVPTLGLLQAGPFWLDAGIGLGVDFFDAELAMLSENRTDGTFAIRLTHPGPFADPVLTAQLLFGIHASPNVSVTLGAIADYDVAPHRYAMPTGPGQERIVFEPWHLRPAFLAGIRMTFDAGSVRAEPRVD